MKLRVYCNIAIDKRHQAVNVNVSGYSHRKYCIGTCFTLNTPWQGEDPNIYKKDECVMAEFLQMKRDMNALDVTREEFMDAVWAVKERYKGILKDGTRKGSQKPARERSPKPTREKRLNKDRINLAMTLINDFDPYAFNDDSRTTNTSDIYNSLGQPLMFRQNWKKAVALGHYNGGPDRYTALMRRYAPDIENWKAIADNDKLRALLEIFDSEPDDEPDEKQYAPYVDPDDWEREMMREIEQIRQKNHTQNEKLHQVHQADTGNNESR